MSSADLTELLRASRPIAPAALRERVRTLAAAPPPASPLARLRTPRLRLRLVVPVLAATAVAAAVAVAVVRPESPRVVAQPGAERAAADAAQRGAATTKQAPSVATQLAPNPPPGAQAPAPTPGRAQDYQAQIGLEVEDAAALSTATKRAMATARDLGGYVVGASYTESGTGSAQLVLRVPTARVQDAIAQLTSLGRITSQQVQIQDLQEQLDALDREIAVLRARIAHVTALLQDPALASERRAALAAQRAGLQRRLAEQRRARSGTAQRAAYATIQLSLATKEQAATPAAGSRLDRTLDEAGRILAWEGVALLYALVVVGPFALLGALAWLGLRLRRRAEEDRLLARHSGRA